MPPKARRGRAEAPGVQLELEKLSPYPKLLWAPCHAQGGHQAGAIYTRLVAAIKVDNDNHASQDLPPHAHGGEHRWLPWPEDPSGMSVEDTSDRRWRNMHFSINSMGYNMTQWHWNAARASWGGPRERLRTSWLGGDAAGCISEVKGTLSDPVWLILDCTGFHDPQTGGQDGTAIIPF